MKCSTLGLNGLKAVYGRVIILLPGKQDLAPIYKTYPPSRINTLTARFIKFGLIPKWLHMLLTYFRTLRLLRSTLIGTARPRPIFAAIMYSRELVDNFGPPPCCISLIVSKVAGFPINCFCFVIIVFWWKTRAQQLVSDSLSNFRIQLSQNTFRIYPTEKANTS